MKKSNLLFCVLFFFGIVTSGKNVLAGLGKEKNNSSVINNYATCTLIASASTTNNVTCNGGSDGSVSATPSSGTAPYTYMWGDGNTNATETGLSAGTYSVTVTDNDGCTATAATSITQPSVLSASTSVSSNVTCNGGSDGSVSSTPSNGTAPYTYSWTGGGTNSTETGLTAGTYSVTVTDNCGATSTATATITQPSTLNTSASVTANITCNGGSDGSVSATPSNGTIPYTYSWTGGGTNSTETGLTAGAYNVTVTDNCGATATTSLSVTQPSALSISASTTANASCNGASTGSVSVTPSNGTSPYTYLWGDATTNSTETGLTAGTYSVTVTDNCGATATASTSITQPTALSVSVSASASAICSGSSSTLTTTVSGGATPYTYSWSPAGIVGLSCSDCQNPVSTPPSTTTYTVSVTDNNGCIGTATVAITVDNPTISASSSSSLICPGANTTLSTSVDGGVSPFTYAWTPSSWLSCSTCSSPIANPTGTINYNVVLTDADGCSGSTSVTVNVDNISVSTSVTPSAPCVGSNAILQVTVVGGVSPLTYLWSPGSNTNSTNSVVATVATATYSCMVTDPNGCSASATASVSADNFIVSLPSRTNICANATSGGTGGTSGLYAEITGGVSPYTYSWSTGNINAFQPLTGLASGIYSVSVTDGDGCTATAVDTLTVFTPPHISITSSANPIEEGDVDTLIASGGIGYAWSDGSTGNRLIVHPLHTTGYSVYGWDSNGCSNTLGTVVVITRDYWLPSPDTTIPHLKSFPPIYFAGNVSVGKDSAASPHQALEVHGNEIIDTNLTVKGNIKSDSMHVRYFAADSIKTGVINLPDSVLTIGDPLRMTIPHACGPIIFQACNGFVFSNLTGYPTPTKVGIGIWPSSALDVSSPGATNGVIANFRNNNYNVFVTTLLPANGDWNSLTKSGDNGIFWDDNNGSGNLSSGFVIAPHSGSSTGIRIDASGKVIIGTGLTTPGNYGLYVGNGILTSVVKIALPTDMVNWSDYVFGSNYKLKPLTEVAAFIKENKHLPDVPSAGDVQKNGINVAEMDATLLKKIEELTLYLIQQQQQSQQQQNEIQELKAQLENLKKNPK